MITLDQLTRPAWTGPSSSTDSKTSNAPASCHFRGRHQQVISDLNPTPDWAAQQHFGCCFDIPVRFRDKPIPGKTKRSSWDTRSLLSLVHHSTWITGNENEAIDVQAQAIM
ncbi:MAG TPA: hypothetical protein PLN52_26410 [Opitutaceae bacterium]|nr:hypothetical protein [Opitutaceae bacterium]